MAKNTQVVAHVERSVKESLEELARQNDRSLSHYIERVLLKHLEQKGRLPPRGAVAKTHARG